MARRAPAEPALVSSVRADLKRWRIAPGSALAACALDLAMRLSGSEVPPAAAAALHGQLRRTLVELEAQADPETQADPLDELRQRRDERRRGA